MDDTSKNCKLHAVHITHFF